MAKVKGFGKVAVKQKSTTIINKIVDRNIEKLAKDIPWLLRLTREEQEKAVVAVTSFYVSDPHSFVWVIYHPDPMIFTIIADEEDTQIEVEVQKYIREFSNLFTDELPFWGRVEAVEQDTEAILAIIPTLTRNWLAED